MMVTVQIPENEDKRLEALESYKILDSLPEEDYNDIVQLVSAVCDTPVALISFIDKERQWLKATVGLEGENNPRDVAFCSHTILNPGSPMIIHDATQDERFRNNPFVTPESGVRFYAGHPLTTPDGLAIGTIGAVDFKPRQMKPEQLDALKTLAKSVVSLLELRKSNLEKDRLIEALQDSNYELEQFSYVASHDLQSPLRTVNGICQLLEDRYKDSADENIKKYLDYISFSTSSMMNMVQDLLEYSRLDHVKNENVEDIEGEKIIEYVCKNLHQDIEDKNAMITHDALPTFRGNASRFTRILQNFITNAIKYQADGNQPKIHVSSREDGEMLEFMIEDNGIGMQQKDCEQIFEPFKRLHGNKKYKGNGIGLAVCKKMIENSGGKVWAVSEPGVGSVFYFRLPKNPAEYTAVSA